MNSSIIESLTLISIVVGIISAIVVIGNGFKASSFIKSLIVLSMAFACVIFLKVIFQFYYQHWWRAYLTMGIILSSLTLYKLVILFIHAYQLKDDESKEKIRKNLGYGISAIAILLIVGMTNLTNLPVFNDFSYYYTHLSEVKISVETFDYMLKNIIPTLFTTVKIAELIIVALISAKFSYIYVFEKYITTYEDRNVIKYIILITIIVSLFSSNIFLSVLQSVAEWF